jgi:hypothetical protein
MYIIVINLIEVDDVWVETYYEYLVIDIVIVMKRNILVYI